MLHRRILIAHLPAILVLGSSAGVLAASIRRLGILGVEEWQSQDKDVVAFVDELRRRGYEEGKNLLTVQRHSGRELGRLDQLAREFASLPVDLIMTTAGQATVAARKATATIPIVMSMANDPVASGFVSSLANPGGNVTGNAIFGDEVQLKQLEILIEAIGGPKRLAVVGHDYYRQAPRWLRQLERLKAAAASRGVELEEMMVPSSLALDQALEALVRNRIEGAIVEGNAAMELSADTVGALVLKHRLPIIMTWRDHAKAGVPLTYGVNLSDLVRRSAVYVARILDGAKPGDLPVELATRFDFTINLRAADALGMKIPRSLILRADELIR